MLPEEERRQCAMVSQVAEILEPVDYPGSLEYEEVLSRIYVDTSTLDMLIMPHCGGSGKEPVEYESTAKTPHRPCKAASTEAL